MERTMNVQQGLGRLSAAWWGFWCVALAIAAVGLAIAGAFNKDIDVFGMAAGSAFMSALSFGAHKLTCWIVAGFFSPRS